MAEILNPSPQRGKSAKATRAKPPTTITDFSVVYRMNPIERIAVIRSGVPASEIASLAARMGRPKERLFKLLDFPRATVDRKASSRQRLSKEQSERALGVARLVGQVLVMVEESGDASGFDAAKWVADWLDRPNPGLGGRLPGEYMDTAEGQELVSNLLLKMQSGAYA